MAQPQRTSKQPLDVLQSMLNGVLIETGKALKSSNKEGSKAQLGTSRPQSTIPIIVAQFQQALDELEIDILRAKSVLSRDLEELRTKRIAKENPVPVMQKAPDPAPILTPTITPKPKVLLPPNLQNRAQAQSTTLQKPPQISQLTKSPVIKKEIITKSPENEPQTPIKPPQKLPDPPKPSIGKVAEPRKPAQVPSPPNSLKNSNAETKTIGFGVNTDSKPSASNPTAPAPQDSLDSLFEIPGGSSGNTEMDFDNMDFDFATNTQGDQSQNQNNSFDLSAFGSTSQGPSTTNTSAPIAPMSGNFTNTASNTQVDELLGLSNMGGDDNMDLDLSMFGAEDSVFDDMFVDGGNMSAGGGEMEHGNFDNDFFGLDN